MLYTYTTCVTLKLPPLRLAYCSKNICNTWYYIANTRIGLYNRFKHEVLLLTLKNVSSYLKENTTRLYDNDELVNVVREIIAVYSENHTKP
jgi:hypothetical protein